MGVDAAWRLSDLLARPIGPKRFRRRPRAAGARTIVCAGDSITHGVMSANYVERLNSRLEPHGYQVVNAGISGDLAHNLRVRLDDVIACDPDVVTVLVGTNDVAAHIDDAWRDAYMKQQKLPRPPSLDWYREELTQIVERLRTVTPAHVALLELPPLGEDLRSEHNRRIEQYNAEIRAVGEAKSVAILDLHARLVSALPAGGTARPFDGSKTLMGKAIVRHHLLRRSYDDVADRHGLTLLTDHVHLADRAAEIVADVIEEFVHAANESAAR